MVGPNVPEHSLDSTRPAKLTTTTDGIFIDTNISHPRLPGKSIITSQPTSYRVGGHSRSRGRGLNRTNDNNRERLRNNRPRPHEQYQENQRILCELFTTKHFKKYILVKSYDNCNLRGINVIEANRVNKSLTVKSKPKKITELRDVSLLVEVTSEEQSNQICILTKLDRAEVAVTEHARLNQIQGMIRCANKPNCEIDTILVALKEFNVTNIHQIKKKSNDSYQHTNIYILTFNACELPKQVNIGWSHCEVRE